MTKLSMGIFMLLISVAAKLVFAGEPGFSVEDKAFICNERSDVTHLRAGPSARNRPITGHLPNSLPVTIQQIKTNETGDLYYYIKIDSIAGEELRSGWVHAPALKAQCDLPQQATKEALMLADQLARNNPQIAAADVISLNAIFDGSSLDLSFYSDLSDISALAAWPNLTFVDLSYTQVSDVAPLQALSALRTLSLQYTSVSNIQLLAGLKSLESLNLHGTAIDHLEGLQSLTQLHTLYLSHSTVQDISALKNMPQIQVLSLSDTNVSDYSALSALKSLRYLSLESAGLHDISFLEPMRSLHTLYIDDNPLTDISVIENLKALKIVGLRSTNVTDLSPLENLPFLREIDLN